MDGREIESIAIEMELRPLDIYITEVCIFTSLEESPRGFTYFGMAIFGTFEVYFAADLSLGTSPAYGNRDSNQARQISLTSFFPIPPDRSH